MTNVALNTIPDAVIASTNPDWLSHDGLSGGLNGLFDTCTYLPAPKLKARTCVYVPLVASWAASRIAPAQNARGEFEKARAEMERLEDGWAGPGSFAPPPAVLSDFDSLASALSMARNAPEFEVDDESGAVTWRWRDTAAGYALSFVLRGNKEVVAVVTELGEAPQATPHRFGLASDDAIVRFILDDDRLAELLGYI